MATPHVARAGKGVFLMPKEFAFQQLFGQRSTRQGDERAITPAAVDVDHMGGQRFSRAGRPREQSGSVGRGGPGDGHENTLHLRTGSAEQRANLRLGRRGRTGGCGFGQEIKYRPFQFTQVERFDQIGCGTQLPRGDRIIQRAARSDDEHRLAHQRLIDSLQHAPPADVRQPKIQNDQRIISLRQPLQARGVGGTQRGLSVKAFANRGERPG